MIDVTLMAYPGMDDLDFFGLLSVLGKAAADIGPDFLRVASAGPTMLAASGVEIGIGPMWTPLSAAPATRCIVVPGGPGALASAADPRFACHLLAARAAGARVYSCCTGTAILGTIGLLHQRQVAMHHRKRAMLADSGCAGIATGMIRDDWLTSIGGDMAPSCKPVDLAMQLLRDIAPATLPQVAARMELAQGRTVAANVAAAAVA